MNPDHGLPDGWAVARLGDLVTVNYGKALKEADRIPGAIPVYGSNGRVGTHTTRLTNGPTIIVGRKGSVGAVHLSDSPCWTIDTAYYVDEYHGLCPEYLAFMLRSLQLASQDTSTAIPGLNRDDLYSNLIPIPPAAEQCRIVGAIRGSLSAVYAVEDRLERARQLMKRFRQSVLAAACSGRLTEDWRDYRGSAHSPGVTDSSSEACQSNKSPGWRETTFDDITTLVTSGSRGWARFYSQVGAVFIRAQDINTNSLDLKQVARVALPNASEGMRTRVRYGDLLVTITGANVGKAAWINCDLGEGYVSQHVALVRPVSPDYSPFLHMWLVSPCHGGKVLTETAYGIGKPGLGLGDIRQLPISFPTREERSEIMRRVDALMSLADSIEHRLDGLAGRAERMTRAILAKAFRGELVPTEAELARREGRDYEPASVLLERIRAERAANPRKAGKLKNAN